jgi:hypothetical protein
MERQVYEVVKGRAFAMSVALEQRDPLTLQHCQRVASLSLELGRRVGLSGRELRLLPVSGVYVMTAQEAAEAARRIAPRVAVPMHWGEHIGARHDATEFAERAPVEVRILDKVAG